jgi:spermidine/putrescine transport system ATP-binding protein
VYRRPANAFVAEFVGASNRLAGTVTARTTAASYKVVLDCNGRTVSLGGAQDLAVGDRVWIIVRPEAAILEGNPSGDSVGGEARVADVSFLGPQTIYKLESEELGDLTVAASAHGVEHQPGSALQVTWPIAKAWAVPMESGAQAGEAHAPSARAEPDPTSSPRSAEGVR